VWRRSKACASSACVEVAEHSSAFFVRDSKNTDSSVLTFDREQWGAFITGIKAGAL
jgi:hypothetical protein